MCKNRSMKRIELSPEPPTADGSRIGSEGRGHSAQFMAARDSRNRRVPGPAVRNGRYYGVLWADRGDGWKAARRFPLVDEDDEPIRTFVAAKEAADNCAQSASKARSRNHAGCRDSMPSLRNTWSWLRLNRNERRHAARSLMPWHAGVSISQTCASIGSPLR